MRLVLAVSCKHVSQITVIEWCMLAASVIQFHIQFLYIEVTLRNMHDAMVHMVVTTGVLPSRHH